MRRLLTTLIFAGACSASVTFPISDHGYTLSLLSPTELQIEAPTSAGTFVDPLDDIASFETILIGNTHKAAFLGKRVSDGGWFFFVEDIWLRRPLAGAYHTSEGFSEPHPSIPAGYHIALDVTPEVFEQNGFLHVRSLFRSATGPDLTLTMNQRISITEGPEPAGLGLVGAGLGALLLRRRRD